MTSVTKHYHPEVVFAIETLLLPHGAPPLILTNDLFDWRLSDLECIKKKYQDTQCLKIKISPATNVSFLGQILNSLYADNKNIKFRLDANRNFEIQEILSLVNALRISCQFNYLEHIEYLEEPLKSANDLFDLKMHCPLPYAADESARVYLLHPTKLIDAYVLKPALYGISDIFRFINSHTDKKVIISSCFEHPSVLRCLNNLAALRPQDFHGIKDELSPEN